RLTKLAQEHPGQMAFTSGYDEELAHLVQSGADALLVPSRFEPCGITQLCAMRYGAVPIVAKVGGLSDTVSDSDSMTATGFHIQPVTAEAIGTTVIRALNTWKDASHWRQLQTNAMNNDVSWKNSAAKYARLYFDLAGRAA